MFAKGESVKLKGGKKVGVITSTIPDIPEHVGCVMVRWNGYQFDVPVKSANLVGIWEGK